MEMINHQSADIGQVCILILMYVYSDMRNENMYCSFHSLNRIQPDEL